MNRFLIILVTLCVLFSMGTGCAETPEECKQLCDQVSKWSETCHAPTMTKETCYTHFEAEGRQSQAGTAVVCWDRLMRWTPKIDAEFDCTKSPPALL